MAVISLNTQQIESINAEITALDNTLLQSYLPELDSELTAIRANVQNAEINQLLSTISQQFNNVKATLAVELPKLEQFLESQMRSYDIQEEEALAALEAVVARMNSLVKNSGTNVGMFGSAATAITGAAGTMAASMNGMFDSVGKTTTTKTTTSAKESTTTATTQLTQKEITDLKDKSNDSIISDMAHGATVGAGAGAVIGGIVGSIVPGAGTAAGAALGAKIGAGVGAGTPVIADIAEGAWDGLCDLGKTGGNILKSAGAGIKASWNDFWSNY